jgi:RNA ligase (TIGR02306 family)
MSDESKGLARIVRVASLTPIVGADRIVLATLEGLAWRCVCNKADFTELGQLGVYFAIDSIVDETNPAFAFMAQHHFRIKNARFKGVYSQGLLMPLSILNHYEISDGLADWTEGLDVSYLTRTKKYIKEIPANLAGKVKGNFPTALIPKTDQDNLLNFPDVLKEFEGKQVYITVKCDGSSGTFIWQNGEFRICSRNLELDTNDNANVFCRVAETHMLKQKLDDFQTNLAIQAECVGPGVQKNPMKLDGLDFRVFTVRSLDDWHYYSLEEMDKLCHRVLDLPMVPMIDSFVFDNKIHTIDWLQALANKTEYAPGVPAEGIVMALCYPEYSATLDRLLSVKVLNQAYKD